MNTTVAIVIAVFVLTRIVPIIKMPLPKRKMQSAVVNEVEVAEEAREESGDEVVSCEEEIPCGQIVIPSQEHGPETQAVVNDLMSVKKKFALKRKKTSKQFQQKKRKTVEEIINEQDPKDDMLSVLGLILVMWTDDFLQTASSALKLIVSASMKEKKFGLKKILYETQRAITSIVTGLQQQGIDVKTCSLQVCNNYFFIANKC